MQRGSQGHARQCRQCSSHQHVGGAPDDVVVGDDVALLVPHKPCGGGIRARPPPACDARRCRCSRAASQPASQPASTPEPSPCGISSMFRVNASRLQCHTGMVQR